MRGNRVDLKNVPIGAWIFASVTVAGALAALVALNISGQDTTDYWRFLNFAFNGLMLLAGSGSLVYAGAAARNSQKAVEQTNGVMAADRAAIAEDAAAKAVAAYRAGGPLR